MTSTPQSPGSLKHKDRRLSSASNLWGESLDKLAEDKESLNVAVSTVRAEIPSIAQGNVSGRLHFSGIMSGLGVCAHEKCCGMAGARNGMCAGAGRVADPHADQASLQVAMSSEALPKRAKRVSLSGSFHQIYEIFGGCAQD